MVRVDQPPPVRIAADHLVQDGDVGVGQPVGNMGEVALVVAGTNGEALGPGLLAGNCDHALGEVHADRALRAFPQQCRVQVAGTAADLQQLRPRDAAKTRPLQQLALGPFEPQPAVPQPVHAGQVREEAPGIGIAGGAAVHPALQNDVSACPTQGDAPISVMR